MRRAKQERPKITFKIWAETPGEYIKVRWDLHSTGIDPADIEVNLNLKVADS